MQCPNEQCNNRALVIMGQADVAVQFKDDGATVDDVAYGEWYLSDASEAYCEECHWSGYYRDCKEEGDTNAV